MDCSNSMEISDSPYDLLLKAASLTPRSHSILGLLFVLLIALYYFLEIHILKDFFTGFRGQRVTLTFNSCSDLYQEVASKCRILHGRYLASPWLSSPHLQTVFLSFFGRAPLFNYRRQLFCLSDGGTIALDWLMNVDVMKASFQGNDAIQGHDKIPLMIVIPGLTSDSDSAYIRHLAFRMAKHGWNVVVSNHRGLGGISITSDCFYNAGWTEDIRKVIDHIHGQYPDAPLFAVGTSIGANILVKYLGEDGVNIPLVGAAAICSPWDLLICDRFINRRLVQKFYDRALTIGLKSYAELHQPTLSRLADWEGIRKSSSVRDFDNYATRVVGKFETVDTYYRRCSSATFVGNIMVPLLCISALDDPVCTKEAIPWDECRANENIILATTQHGGHLAYFEGISAKSLWWVRAVEEFFSIMIFSPLIHRKKKISSVCSQLGSSIDQGPFVNIREDGMMTAVSNEPIEIADLQHKHAVQDDNNEDIIPDAGKNDNQAEEMTADAGKNDNQAEQTTAKTTTQPAEVLAENVDKVVVPIRKCVDKLSRRSTKSIWLLVYIAIITSWPLIGSALFLLKNKFRNVRKAKLQNG